MTATKRLAVLIAYGPEARAFVQSGLAERLSASHELVFAATAPDSPALRSAPGEILQAPQALEPLTLTRLRRLRARTEAASWKDIAARAAESLTARAFGGSPDWRRWFQRQRIALVLAGSYSSARTLPALDAAARLGVPSVVLTNSWKDVHQKPHCGPSPAAVGVFAESERRRSLAANPSFPAERVRSIGSLHCAALLRAEALSPTQLSAELGLDPGRPFLLYVAARDGKAERDVLDSLLGAARTLPGRPQVVVRLNPMDAAAWAEDFRAGRDDLVFDRPSWTWEPEREWICPLPEDAPRWSALLRQAAAIVSRPSTVAWEGAAVERQTLTVAWGRSREAWDAVDFGEARSRGWVRGVLHADDLRAALGAELAQPEPPATPAASGAVELACALVEAALTPRGGRAVLSIPAIGGAAR